MITVTHDMDLASRADRTVIISDGEVIDPIVAGTLPSLDHPQMLQATHDLQRRSYEPGEIVISRGEPVNHFYMIESGTVEILDNESMADAELGPNDFFGEIELTGDETALATVRAATNLTIKTFQAAGCADAALMFGWNSLTTIHVSAPQITPLMAIMMISTSLWSVKYSALGSSRVEKGSASDAPTIDMIILRHFYRG